MSESGIMKDFVSSDQPRPSDDRVRNEHSLLSSIGLLILRVGIGGLMVSHGWGKFQMLMAGDFHKFGDPIGIGSAASLLLIVTAEFICALLVMIGAATRVAAIFPVIGMAVAAFIVHGGDPWTMGEGARLFYSGASQSWSSKEPALLFLIPFLALVFTGAGRFSVDALVRSYWQSRRQQTR